MIGQCPPCVLRREQLALNDISYTADPVDPKLGRKY